MVRERQNRHLQGQLGTLRQKVHSLGVWNWYPRAPACVRRISAHDTAVESCSVVNCCSPAPGMTVFSNNRLLPGPMRLTARNLRTLPPSTRTTSVRRAWYVPLRPTQARYSGAFPPKCFLHTAFTSGGALANRLQKPDPTCAGTCPALYGTFERRPSTTLEVCTQLYQSTERVHHRLLPLKPSAVRSARVETPRLWRDRRKFLVRFQSLWEGRRRPIYTSIKSGTFPCCFFETWVV